jgi:hypothetical protein
MLIELCNKSVVGRHERLTPRQETKEGRKIDRRANMDSHMLCGLLHRQQHDPVSKLKRRVKTQTSKEQDTKVERTESRTSTIGHQRAPLQVAFGGSDP